MSQVDESPMSADEEEWTAMVVAGAASKAARRRANRPPAPLRLPSSNQLANFPRGISCVYVIGEEDQRIVKIGWSSDLRKRLSDLRCNSPQVNLGLLWATDGGRDLEKILHDHFSSRCIKGEWFAFPYYDAVIQVQDALGALRDVRPLPVGVEDIRRQPVQH